MTEGEIPEGYLLDTTPIEVWFASYVDRLRVLTRTRARRRARAEIVEAARVLNTANRSLAETGEARMALAAGLDALDKAS